MPPGQRLPRIPIRVPRLSTRITLQGAAAFGSPDEGALYDALQRGAMRAAQLVRGTWVTVAKGMGIDRTGDYIDGIKDRARVEVLEEARGANLGGYRIVIGITNTSKHAMLVEEGHAAFSLPDAIQWGKGSPRMKRVMKGPNRGMPYLTIPFRHYAYASPSKREEGGYKPHVVAQMLPSSIHKLAQSLERTLPEGAGPQYKGKQFLAADRYRGEHGDRWGGVLVHDAPVGSTMQLAARGADAKRHAEVRRDERVVGVDKLGNTLTNPAWKTSKFQGLSRMNASGHTQYMTFRIITPKSKGWRIPAMQGKFVMARIVHSMNGGALREQIARAIQLEAGRVIGVSIAGGT